MVNAAIIIQVPNKPVIQFCHIKVTLLKGFYIKISNFRTTTIRFWFKEVS